MKRKTDPKEKKNHQKKSNNQSYSFGTLRSFSAFPFHDVYTSPKLQKRPLIDFGNWHFKRRTQGQNMAEDNQEFCLVCCDELSVVAIGSCDHQGTCAICSVRLRQVRQLAFARQNRPATHVGRTRFMRKRQLQQDALKTNVEHGWAGNIGGKFRFEPSCMDSRDFPIVLFPFWLMMWHGPSRNRPDIPFFQFPSLPYLDTDEDVRISCVGIPA